jgi:hypothetical protein
MDPGAWYCIQNRGKREKNELDTHQNRFFAFGTFCITTVTKNFLSRKIQFGG